MAKRDGASLWVQLLHGDLQVVDRHGCLGCEGLVDLVDVDVVDGHAGLLESDWDGESRADTHQLRVNADASEAAKSGDDGQAHLLGG